MSKLSKYCYRQKTKARHILEKAAQKEIDDFCHLPEEYLEEMDEFDREYYEDYLLDIEAGLFDYDNHLDDGNYYNEDPLDYYDDLDDYDYKLIPDDLSCYDDSDLYWKPEESFHASYEKWYVEDIYELAKENRELKAKIQSLEKFIKTELLPPPDRGVDNRLA